MNKVSKVIKCTVIVILCFFFQPTQYGRGRGSWARGSWNPRGRGRGGVQAGGSMMLDNRPKTVQVKGFELQELEDIKTHFMVSDYR